MEQAQLQNADNADSESDEGEKYNVLVDYSNGVAEKEYKKRKTTASKEHIYFIILFMSESFVAFDKYDESGDINNILKILSTDGNYKSNEYVCILIIALILF